MVATSSEHDANRSANGYEREASTVSVGAQWALNEWTWVSRACDSAPSRKTAPVRPTSPSTAAAKPSSTCGPAWIGLSACGRRGHRKAVCTARGRPLRFRRRLLRQRGVPGGAGCGRTVPGHAEPGQNRARVCIRSGRDFSHTRNFRRSASLATVSREAHVEPHRKLRTDR